MRFSQGLLQKYDENKKKLYYVDKQDKVFIKDIELYDSNFYSQFHENKAAVFEISPADSDDYEDENGKVSYGYVNKNGKWLVKKE